MATTQTDEDGMPDTIDLNTEAGRRLLKQLQRTGVRWPDVRTLMRKNLMKQIFAVRSSRAYPWPSSPASECWPFALPISGMSVTLMCSISNITMACGIGGIVLALLLAAFVGLVFYGRWQRDKHWDDPPLLRYNQPRRLPVTMQQPAWLDMPPGLPDLQRPRVVCTQLGQMPMKIWISHSLVTATQLTMEPTLMKSQPPMMHNSLIILCPALHYGGHGDVRDIIAG
ncbi:MAG: hypothetical protein R2867_04230 [Caldilineaceae bacterium]